MVFTIYIIVFAILGAYLYGPLPGSQRPNDDMFYRQLPHRSEIAAKLNEIPIDKSVTVTNELGAQLSHRERIYTAATDVTNADYVALFLRDSDEEPDTYTEELIDFLKKDMNFEIWYQDYGLTIFKKN